MCTKLPYRNPRIDKCLIEEIKEINNSGIYKSLASCCGHGIYPKTIIVEDKLTKKIMEYFSGIYLTPKKRNRYYKKDLKGYYYIPEIQLNNKKIIK